MRSKYFVSLALIGSGLLLASLGATGCGSSSSGSTTNGDGGGATTTNNGGATSTSTNATTGSQTTVGPTGTTTGTGAGTGGAGGGPGPGHTIDTAVALVTDGSGGVETDFVDTSTPDFYSFTAAAGDRLLIIADPPDLGNEYTDDTITAPVFALIGPDKDLTKDPLTFGSGAWPYAGQHTSGFIEITTAGTYYLQVSDCNAFFQSGCNDPSNITDLTYDVAVILTSKLATAPEIVASASQDGTTAKADALTFTAGTTAGQYDQQFFGGQFSSGKTKQVFSFKAPSDLAGSAGGRDRADFYVQAIGSVYGDLSTSSIKTWVTDSTGKILAQADQANYAATDTSFSPLDLSVPVTKGSTYYVYAQDDNATVGASDFYFVTTQLDGLINQTPPTGTLNETSATAYALTAQGTDMSLYVVDADLPVVATPAWYSLTVPAGNPAFTKVGIQCDAARSGSGLQGFKAEVFKSDGTTSIVSGSETATTDLLVDGTALPADSKATGTKLFLKVSATGQDTTNTGSQYRCYVFFE